MRKFQSQLGTIPQPRILCHAVKLTDGDGGLCLSVEPLVTPSALRKEPATILELDQVGHPLQNHVLVITRLVRVPIAQEGEERHGSGCRFVFSEPPIGERPTHTPSATRFLISFQPLQSAFYGILSFASPPVDLQ